MSQSAKALSLARRRERHWTSYEEKLWSTVPWPDAIIYEDAFVTASTGLRATDGKRVHFRGRGDLLRLAVPWKTQRLLP